MTGSAETLPAIEQPSVDEFMHEKWNCEVSKGLACTASTSSLER
jgi:hypothetical protein